MCALVDILRNKMAHKKVLKGFPYQSTNFRFHYSTVTVRHPYGKIIVNLIEQMINPGKFECVSNLR